MYAVRRALERYRSLTFVERSLLAEAALLVPAVHALQTVAPFRVWRAWMTVGGLRRAVDLLSRTSAPGRERPTPEMVAQAIERARKGVPGVYKCLPQAYAGYLLLRRYGYDSSIQVGVSRDAKGAVEAHAWVELDGRVLIGELPDLARFVPLPPLRV